MVSCMLMTPTISYIDQNYENSPSSVIVQEEKTISPVPPAPCGPCNLCPTGFDMLK